MTRITANPHDVPVTSASYVPSGADAAGSPGHMEVTAVSQMTWFELQNLLVRVYVGLDFTHHFAEKFGLLGPSLYQNDIVYFSDVVPGDPHLWVLLSGLCEFGAFIGFTFGLFTRTAALGTAAYLLAASVMGGHFSNDFTWLNRGGGWEYPMLWTVLCASFALTGGGRISADAWLRRQWPRAPKWLLG